MSLFYLPRASGFDTNGALMSGARLYFYTAGTSTPKNTYSDAALATANANPVVANSSGLFGPIFMGAGGYKVVLTSASGVEMWSQDNFRLDSSYNQGGTGAVDRTITNKLQEFISVQDFGAAGDGSTDDTAAIQAAAVALQAAGGGLLTFERGKTYRIYPTGTVSGSVAFCSFSGLSGVAIDLNGATLAVEDTLTTGEQIQIFSFSNCSNIEIMGGSVTSNTTVAVAGTSYGLNVFDFTNGCKNISIDRIVLSGALTGVRCYRTPASEAETTKVRGLTITNYNCTNVAQPLSFQNSGDDVLVRSTRINLTHRAYFPYGVRNHDIAIHVTNTTTSCARLAAYSTDTTTNYLENIKVNLTVSGYDNTTAAPYFDISAIYDSAANGCTLRNIDMRINAKFNDSSSTSQRLLSISKQLNNDGDDSTASRGHIFENIVLSGAVYGVDIAGHEVCQIFNNGDFTDETCRNVGFRDLVVSGSVDHVLDLGDLRSMDGEFFLDNCYFSGTASISPTNWGTRGVRLRNTYILGQYFEDSSYPRTYTNSGTVSAFHGRIYMDSSGGAIALTLPDGQWIGQECTIIMTEASNSSTVSVSNHETSDPEVFTFAQTTDILILRWMGSQWITVANSGVAV